MKFSAREDIEAPIGFVFEQVTDFTAIERSALRRGAEVQRIDTLASSGPGMKWDASFRFRGRLREINLELTALDPPNTVVLESRSSNMGGAMMIDLVALSRARTRMSVEIEIEPKTLAARLLVQSMKLARNSLTRKFRKRVADHAEEIEIRFGAQIR